MMNNFTEPEDGYCPVCNTLRPDIGTGACAYCYNHLMVKEVVTCFQCREFEHYACNLTLYPRTCATNKMLRFVNGEAVNGE